jgi:Hypothetical glycosyl hydrolase family 15
MKHILWIISFILCSCRTVSVSAAPGAGMVHFFRTATASLDPYTNDPPAAQQDWFRRHFWRMLVYSPHFDTKLSWYPNGLVYIPIYGIYANSPLAKDHPEWILEDGAGNKLFIPWGCAAGTCPQYAGDISSSDFRRQWIAQAQNTVAKGYRGLWIDDVNMDFRVGNGAGAFVTPFDRNTGALMTTDDWRRYMAEFAEQIRAAFPKLEIVHNSIWFAGPPGIRDRDRYIQREIEACDYVSIELGVNDRGLTGGTGEWSLNALLAYIDRVHAAGKGVILGGVAAEPSAREYALANYYLISTGSDAVCDRTTTPENWWPGFETNLGAPAGPRTTWNGLLRRDFSNGMALVNPPQHSPVTFSLPASAHRIDGSSFSRQVTLGPSQGLVVRDAVLRASH